MNLGRFYYYLGRMGPAEETYRQVLAHLEPKVGPRAVPYYRESVGTTYVNLAKLLRDVGRRAEAEDAYAKARALLEPLAREFPERLFYAGVIGRIQEGVAKLRKEAGDPEAAIRGYDEATRTLEAVLSRDRQYEPARRYLRELNEGRAEALTQLGRHEAAIAAWDRALEYDDGRGPAALRLGRALSRARAGQAGPAAQESWDLARAEALGRAAGTCREGPCPCPQGGRRLARRRVADGGAIRPSGRRSPRPRWRIRRPGPTGSPQDRPGLRVAPGPPGVPRPARPPCGLGSLITERAFDCLLPAARFVS